MAVSLMVAVLIALTPVISTSESHRYRRQDWSCEATEKMIVGPWRWEENITCPDLNARIVDEYDAPSRDECLRWMGVRPTQVDYAVEECSELDNGTTRFRYQICCPDTIGDAIRCFKCTNSPVVRDDVMRRDQVEECNYYSEMETCSDDQVCQSTVTYSNCEDPIDRRITKGCADKKTCKDLKKQNDDLCVNGLDNPTCVSCCDKPFCNKDVKIKNRVPCFACYNGGTVVTDENDPSNRSCACPPGFSGDLCQSDVCDEDVGTCKNSGGCTNTNEEPYFNCFCRPGYTGATCESLATECDDSEQYCKNAGSKCYDYGGNVGEICVCGDGWIGTQCDIPRIVCETDAFHLNDTLTYLKTWGSNCDEAIEKINNKLDDGWKQTINLKKCYNAMGNKFKDATDFGQVESIETQGVSMCQQSPDGLGVWFTLEFCCPACFSNPCQHNGMCLPDGEGFKCQCTFGYEGTLCDTRSSICVVTGDPHFETFDGKNIDFQGNCLYYLAYPDLEEEDPPFTVLIQHEPRGSDVVSYIRYIEVELHSPKVTIRLDRNKVVLVDGVLVSLEHTGQGYSIGYNGQYVRLITDLGLVVEFDGIWVAIVKIPDELYKGKMRGLCSNFDDDPENDFTTRDGVDVRNDTNKHTVFGNSWQVDPEECTPPAGDPKPCNETQEEELSADDKCGYVQTPPNEFTKCLNDSRFEEALFTQNCLYDACANYPDYDDAICRSWESAAIMCKQAGYVIDDRSWRENTSCMPDCGEDKEYHPLASACPATCQHPDSNICGRPPTEDCVCKPDRPVLKNGTCVTPSECDCEDEYGIHPIGSQWYTDDCEESRNCVACDDCPHPVGKIDKEAPGCPADKMCNVSQEGELSCVPRCTDPKVWSKECGLTCTVRTTNASVCSPGCVCKEGLVEGDYGDCVDPTTCGCLDTYGDRHTVGTEWVEAETCAKYKCAVCSEGHSCNCIYPNFTLIRDSCPFGQKCNTTESGESSCIDICENGKEYSIDKNPCDATCDNPRAPDDCMDQPYIAGCECPAGLLVLDDRCVQPQECGCVAPTGRVQIGSEWKTLDCKTHVCEPCSLGECGAEIGVVRIRDKCPAHTHCVSNCTATCSSMSVY